MSTSNNDPDDQAPDETDIDQELRDLVDGKFHQPPGFSAEHDPYDDLDADVVSSHRIDPALRERAMETVRAPLPEPVYISSRPRNVFIRMYRWFRNLRRR
jgi:hypothetical protein